MSKDKDYEVGYGKPPKHSRYAPGVSGNSKGKPKMNRTFEEEVQAVLTTRVPVTINGKKKYVTKRQLLIEQIVNGAINKNTTMMRLALPLLRTSDGTPAFETLPEDEEALQTFLENLGVRKDEGEQS